MARERTADGSAGPVGVADLLDQLDRLEETVDAAEERREVEQTREMAERLSPGMLGTRIRKYTTRDVAQAFVGSVVFALPLLVEDGVNEIAGHFLAVHVSGIPVFLAANVVFLATMTGALIYWADIQRIDVTTRVAGVPIPRRLIGTLVVSLATATVMMAMWGRVGTWQSAPVAGARISVVWTAAAIGGALGDILPGESAGEDISIAFEDGVRDLLDRVD